MFTDDVFTLTECFGLAWLLSLSYKRNLRLQQYVVLQDLRVRNIPDSYPEYFVLEYVLKSVNLLGFDIYSVVKSILQENALKQATNASLEVEAFFVHLKIVLPDYILITNFCALIIIYS